MACYFPFYVNDKPVPCGYCPACCLRRSNAWAFRCAWEHRRCISVSWLRLSYSDDFLVRASNGRPTLCKEHIQKFMKRYRYYMYESYLDSLDCFLELGLVVLLEYDPLKYFLCGEYGSRFQRPHYHVLVFNGDDRYLLDAWKFGEVYIDPRPFDPSCVIYTCGYMLKPCTAGYGRDTRERKFLLMSKRLGDNYLTPAQIDWHWRSPDRNFVTMLGGVKSALPRYFADKIFKPKAVNGVICPVARLACDLFAEERNALLDVSTRSLYQKFYNDHVFMWGNADDFIRSQSAARMAAIVEFQKKGSAREDL